jgi:hypothetical protein
MSKQPTAKQLDPNRPDYETGQKTMAAITRALRELEGEDMAVGERRAVAVKADGTLARTAPADEAGLRTLRRLVGKGGTIATVERTQRGLLVSGLNVAMVRPGDAGFATA